MQQKTEVKYENKALLQCIKVYVYTESEENYRHLLLHSILK